MSTKPLSWNRWTVIKYPQQSLRFLGTILFLLTLADNLTAHAALLTDVYIADRGWNQQGNWTKWFGTNADNAFNGNGQDKNDPQYWFDRFMWSFANTPTRYVQNLTIHIVGGGVLPTWGKSAWTVQPNWTIRGDGPARPVIQLKNLNTNPEPVVTVIYGATNHDVLIEHLTVDCNASELRNRYPRATRWMLNAVELHGGNNLKLNDVIAQNGYGRSSTESFFIVFQANTATSNPVTGWTITNCQVSGWQGGYGDGITMNGEADHPISGALIAGCTVVWPTPYLNPTIYSRHPSGDGQGPMFGINVVDPISVTIQSNSVFYGSDGFHQDTGECYGISLLNNFFYWPQGFGIGLYDSHNSLMKGNYIELTNTFDNVAVSGIAIGGLNAPPGEPGVHDWQIVSNYVYDKTVFGPNPTYFNRAIGFWPPHDATTITNMAYIGNHFDCPKLGFQNLYNKGPFFQWSNNEQYRHPGTVIPYPGCDAVPPNPSGLQIICDGVMVPRP